MSRGFEEIILHVTNEGNLKLLTRPDRRQYADPRDHNNPTPWVVKEVLPILDSFVEHGDASDASRIPMAFS